MKRDGSSTSIWQQAPDYKPTNQWNKEQIYDVAIIGGGITGITTALVLQQEGVKCIVLEAHNIGFGTTGATTAHLNTLLDTPYSKVAQHFGTDNARLLARGTREAIDLVEGLINKYNINCCFSYQTGYVYAQTPDETKELSNILESAQDSGVVCSPAENIPVAVTYEKTARFDFQAQMNPMAYLNGIASAMEIEGGVLLQNCTASGVEFSQHFTINTSLGFVKAQKIIYATHIPPGLNIFNFNCAPYRTYVIAFTLKGGKYPEGLIYDMKDPYHYFRTQEINGQKYIIAGGCDHKTGHNDNAEYSFTELEVFARSIFDIDKVHYKWSSQYYESADGLPYIGLMPGEQNMYVATGYGGNGMIYGTLAARVLCSIVTGNHNPLEELFKPDRIKIVAGFENFVKENADVATQFLKGKFNYEKISQLAQLAPGEAVVAKWENKKVALYKDENGHVHAVSPTCPHAGCTVSWNNAEHTWDCPCHGSRFASNGDLLNGPATKGLESMKWEDLKGD